MCTVMIILGDQLDFVWNEPQCKNRGYTHDRFPAWFEVGQCTSNLDLWGRKTQVFDPDLKAERHTFNLSHTFCGKPTYKNMKEGSPLSLSC